MAPETDDVKAFFNQPHRYLHKRFGLRLRAEITQELLGPLSAVRILDIGCGDGSISLPYLFSGNSLVLLDLSESMLQLARRNTPAAMR